MRIHYDYGMIFMGSNPYKRVDMSTDQRDVPGIQHLTVVPENFEPSMVVDREDE
jgi:hypothetical protein